jgi:hypothetical protein
MPRVGRQLFGAEGRNEARPEWFGRIARADEAAPERDGLLSVPGGFFDADTLPGSGSPHPGRVEAEKE